MSEIKVESLVPVHLRTIKSSEEYMKRLPEFDGESGVWL